MESCQSIVCPLCIPEVLWPPAARPVLCSDCRRDIVAGLDQVADEQERRVPLSWLPLAVLLGIAAWGVGTGAGIWAGACLVP